MITVKDKITRIRNFADAVLKDLEIDESLDGSDAVRSLIDKCLDIDAYYEQFCAECDDNWGEEPGTSYRDGVSLEFYLESSTWHDVSLELRKLKDKV